MGNNYNRINKIEPFLQCFNFENINYPVKKEDCKIFERNNKSIKIYLLLLENKHYTYVTKPQILLKYLKN